MSIEEIGGYLELDRYTLPMLHENAFALNCGRSCLAYLIRMRHIKKIVLPKLLCDSISDVCYREKINVKYYSVNMSFRPINVSLGCDEWIYIVNYYGQLNDEALNEIIYTYKRVIIDQAHAYYQMPIQGIDTLYTCRKFFGVPDGAFLYTEMEVKETLPCDESYNRLHFLAGRFEKTGTEFYEEYIANEEKFYNEPVKRMSKLTYNMLHAIDYNNVKKKRAQNFRYLHKHLKQMNRLRLSIPDGPYMYPLYINNGMYIRKQLQKEKIYIPILWPDVLRKNSKTTLEYDMVSNILPLPVDQRYGYREMDTMISYIRQIL